MSAPSTALERHAPPRFCHIPAVGGCIGEAPDDFVVDEIPLYEASGSGQHLFVRVRKRSMTTPELCHAVARAAGVNERDIGYAGLKDRHAVTTQWLSLPAAGVDPERWDLPDGVEVLAVRLHENKLRTGHLAANAFDIRVVGAGEGGAERAGAVVAFLIEQGVPNYFGPQRFGGGGTNLAAALDWARAGLPRTRRFKAKLWPSVLQAEVFNRYLTSRLALGTDRLLDGEVVRLDRTTRWFVVDDPEKERPRLHARDVHLTGPVFGPRAPRAARRGAALELAALGELELSDADLARLGKLAPGTRRDLFMRPTGAAIEPGVDASFRVCFSLPAGGYATQVIGEITGTPDPRRSSDARGRP
ncbi:MAG TPA: tRNA pseudouridine(13) synthase TruD [Polyangiaceae bacterium]